MTAIALTENDEELIAAWRGAGDRSALEILLRRHLAGVHRLVTQMVLDASVADDLSQEVFLRAFRALEGFDGRARFSTWLYRVAMNTTYSYLDRRSRSPVSFQHNVPDQTDSPAEGPERTAMRGELQRDVGLALAELSPKLRAAVVLTSLEHRSPAEAAEIEGCSTATLYWRIHEARRQLKHRLQKHFD